LFTIIVRCADDAEVEQKAGQLLFKDIGMDLKKQFVRSLIWSTVLNGSENWVLKKCDEKLVTAFEMWVMDMTSDAENQLDRMENQNMDSLGNSLSTATGKEEVIAWFWLQLRVKLK